MKSEELEKYESRVNKRVRKVKRARKRRKQLRIIVWVVALLLPVLVLGFYLGRKLETFGEGEEKSHQLSEDSLYEVVRVSDGDTIVIDCNGEEVTVRLIGVDTPESVHPDEGQNTSEGEIAAEYTKNLLEGKSVTLKFDEDYYDRYDRVLAYVYLDGEMINALLLEQGYARVEIYEPNDEYEIWFEGLEAAARLKKVGFWSDGEW